MMRDDLWKSDGVGWRVAGKIRVEHGKSVRVRCKVDVKNPGDLRRSAGKDGKTTERLATIFGGSAGVGWKDAGKTRGDLRRSDGVGWRVAGKIHGELGKSAGVGWKVAAKNPGDLRRSAGVDGKMPERFASNFRDRVVIMEKC